VSQASELSNPDLAGLQVDHVRAGQHHDRDDTVRRGIEAAESHYNHVDVERRDLPELRGVER
jgi:hypothetical protein